MKNFVIACGGTGGHLTPGIGLAQALEEKGSPCWLFISKKQVDSRLSSKYKKMSLLCPCKMKLKKFLHFTIDNLCFKI